MQCFLYILKSKQGAFQLYIKIIFLTLILFSVGCSTLNFHNFSFKQKKELKIGMSKASLDKALGGNDPYFRRDGESKCEEQLFYYYDALVNTVYVCESLILTVKEGNIS